MFCFLVTFFQTPPGPQSSILCSKLSWCWNQYFSCKLRFISSDCRCPRDRCWSPRQLFLVSSKAREDKEEQCPQKGFISHNLNIFLRVEKIPTGIAFYSCLTIKRAKDDKGRLRYPDLDMPKREKQIPKPNSVLKLTEEFWEIPEWQKVGGKPQISLLHFSHLHEPWRSYKDFLWKYIKKGSRMRAGVNSQESLTTRRITLPFTGYFPVIAHFKSEWFLDNTLKDFFSKMTSLDNDLDETFFAFAARIVFHIRWLSSCCQQMSSYLHVLNKEI